MYSPDDTIAAVSSPSLLPGKAGRTILRLSGPKTFEIVNCILKIAPKRGIQPFRIQLPENVWADGMAYCFITPASYTGQDLVELHILAAPPVVESIFRQILNYGARQAGPGEFTQRAYLNGKFDLSQAEAVMHIISAGNQSQISAAQRLLGGGLSQKISQIAGQLLELLSLLEAGLDFAEEDIELITPQQACDKINLIDAEIHNLLDGAVRCEELMDLPSVGLAGLSGSGKSSLMNALTHRPRSLVSDAGSTTRDILSELLELSCGWCALFDCAGLDLKSAEILDQMAQEAGAAALRSASAVIFCIDLTSPNVKEAENLFKQLGAKFILPVATKIDLLDSDAIEVKLQQLQQIFNMTFIAVSSVSSAGLDTLKTKLSSMLLSARAGQDEAEPQIAINLRHRQRLKSSLKHLAEAAEEINVGRPEVGVMLLRQARGELAGLEHEHLDERILDVIFSKFCIGK